jgi:hypothetical protein
VGFAAVSTSLIINGNTAIKTNATDFDVYFSSAIAETGGSATITSNKKQITYNTKELLNVGDTATLDYSIYNNSSNYDASVLVDLSIISEEDYSSYYSITTTGFNSGGRVIIPGKRDATGSITITLIKPATTDITVTFTVTFAATAQERTELATSATCDANEGECTYSKIGEEVVIGTEHFYYIGRQDSNHVKLLAKYPLNIGERAVAGTTGIQNENCTGTACTVAFDSYSNHSSAYWKNNNGGLKSQYGTNYPAYVFDSNSDNYVHIANYLTYLRNTSSGISVRLLNYDEAVSLGCDPDTYACPSAPDWLTDYSYWLGSAMDDDRTYLISTGSSFNFQYYSYFNAMTLRPVVIFDTDM